MFHQGIQTRENGMKHKREARVFYCFRVFGSPDDTRETSCLHNISNETFHWLFNLLSANGGPMKVICFCLCEQWR